MVPGGAQLNEGENGNNTMIDPPYQEDDGNDYEDFSKPKSGTSEKNNNQVVTDGSNQESNANLLQHIDGMDINAINPNVELIKAALGDQVEAIEITVTPEISQLGNLVKDVEKSLKENAEFKNTMNENYIKNKIELDTRQTHPVNVVAEEDKKMMVAKRATKVGLVCIVLLSLVVAFTALLINNSKKDPEIWPKTV